MYHFPFVQMAIINESTKKQVLVRMWRKGDPSTLVVEMQTSAASMENDMELPMTHRFHFWEYLKKPKTLFTLCSL